jgi:uncharacterized protein (TIGR02145 family)
MKRQILFTAIAVFLNIIFSAAQEKGTYQDPRDGKTYKTVKIGGKTWFAENLAYKLDSGCYVYSEELTATDNYGLLYSWYVAKDACPPGWHLPSDAEWLELADSIGGIGVAGYKLKEAGTKHWESPNGGANNLSGFTALPAGCRDKDFKFKFLGTRGFWWTSSQPHPYAAKYVFMINNSSFLIRDYCNMSKCFSIRCVKD